MEFKEFRDSAKSISNDPYSRIPDHIKPLIERDDVLIDCHCHIFNQKTVPKVVFNMKIPWWKEASVRLIHFLHRLHSRSSDDPASNIAYFLQLIEKPTKYIADKLISYYTENTIFTPLMMDMHNRADKNQREKAEYYIFEQAKDIKNLIDLKYNLLPFLPIDPTFNDENDGYFTDVFDVFIKGFSGAYSGLIPFGIKIYPSLGYLPAHPKLMEIFKVCEEKNIPVTTHCILGTVHSYQHKIKNILGWKIGPDGEMTDEPETRWFFGGKAFSNYFNHPNNWEKVLETFPKLRLNIGHFGGADQWNYLMHGKNNTWCSRIMDYFTRFENVYSDLSYTDASSEILGYLRDRFENSSLFRSRLLYGFDYFMVVLRGHFRSIKVDFDTAMGDEIVRKIGIENPRKFLLG